MKKTRILSVIIILITMILFCSDEGSNNCRTYATQLTVTTSDISAIEVGTVITALFDPAAKELSLSLELSGVPTTTTYKYNSVSDFILEGEYPGLILSYERTNVDGEKIVTYTFDSDKRVTRVVKDKIDPDSYTDETTDYTSWDSNGRPTAGTSDLADASNTCEDVAISISYDDSARTVTTTADFTGSGCSISFNYTRTETYNSNSDNIKYHEEQDGIITEIEYRVDSTSSYCI